MCMIINGPYGVKFRSDSVELHFGEKVVEHRKVKKSETELEVAMSLIEHYKRNGGYNHWLKIERLIENPTLPLEKMKNEDVFLAYMKSVYVRELNKLAEKIMDTSLNDIWEERSC